MKRANLDSVRPGAPQPAEPARTPSSAQSQTRTLGSRAESPIARAPRSASEGPRERRAPPSSDADEPRTGVVRRIDAPLPRAPQQSQNRVARPRPLDATRVPAPVAGEPAARVPPSSRGERPSRRAASPTRHAELRASEDRDVQAWRCLEWGEGRRMRRPRKNPKVSIAQLGADGDCVRQSGPDAWLPEAGSFMHKMADLVAQGFGFERCRGVCLRGQASALSVSLAGDRQLMAVSGPLASLSNVLRRAGLE